MSKLSPNNDAELFKNLAMRVPKNQRTALVGFFLKELDQRSVEEGLKPVVDVLRRFAGGGASIEQVRDACIGVECWLQCHMPMSLTTGLKYMCQVCYSHRSRSDLAAAIKIIFEDITNAQELRKDPEFTQALAEIRDQMSPDPKRGDWKGSFPSEAFRCFNSAQKRVYAANLQAFQSRFEAAFPKKS